MFEKEHVSDCVEKERGQQLYASHSTNEPPPIEVYSVSGQPNFGNTFQSVDLSLQHSACHECLNIGHTDTLFAIAVRFNEPIRHKFQMDIFDSLFSMEPVGCERPKGNAG